MVSTPTKARNEAYDISSVWHCDTIGVGAIPYCPVRRLSTNLRRIALRQHAALRYKSSSAVSADLPICHDDTQPRQTSCKFIEPVMRRNAMITSPLSTIRPPSPNHTLKRARGREWGTFLIVAAGAWSCGLPTQWKRAAAALAKLQSMKSMTIRCILRQCVSLGKAGSALSESCVRNAGEQTPRLFPTQLRGPSRAIV